MNLVKRCIGAMAIVLLLSVDSWAQEKDRVVLWAVSTDDDSQLAIGIMSSAETCSQVASALNVWAKAPPVTPQVFVCRNRVVRA